MSTLEVSAPAVRGPRGGEIARLAPWFHNLHLPDGTETAPQHSHYLAQARWAAREFGLDDRVELGQLSVYDLARTAELRAVFAIPGEPP